MDTNPAMESLHHELLRHARWLEQLARHLVREDEAAADLAQDTLLAALRHPPTRLADLRPWLARVMRNRHKDLGRRAQRRDRRESQAATPEAQPDSTLAVERLELEQALLAGVRGLAEPFRTAVTLRYLEGLEPVEIARRQGIPAGTVRWRVSEGLQRLRRTLDHGRGGRPAWVRAYLPLAGLGAAKAEAAAAATLPALLLGSLAMKLTVASVVLVSAAWLTWSLWSGDPVSASPSGTSQTPPGTTIATGSGNGDATSNTLAERTPVPDETRSRNEGVDTLAPAGRVTVQVVDDQGLPLPGILVASDDVPGLREQARTDVEGRLTVSWAEPPVGHSAGLTLTGPGRESRSVRQEVLAEGVDFGTLLLRPGARVAGRVVDEAGVPQAGASVRADNGAIALLAETFDSEQTDDQGRFEFAGLPEGFVRLRTSLAGDRMGREQETTMRLRRGLPREDLEIRVSLPEGSGVTDGVILRPDGTPSAHAELFARAENDSSSGTFRVDVDAQGRFTIQGWRYDEYHLSAVDRSDPSLRLQELPVARGTRGLALQLAPVSLVELVVRDAEGNAVTDAKRSLSVQRDGDESLFPTSLHLTRQEDRLLFAPPTVPYQFEARATGYETGRSALIDPTTPRQQVEVVLKALPRVTGRVTVQGVAVAGARVQLLRAVADNSVEHRDGLRLQWVTMHASPAAQTDAEGRFVLPYEPPTPPPSPGLWDRLRGRGAASPRPFAVHVATEGRGFAFSGPFAIEAQEPPPPVELELVPGGGIEGTLRLAAGEDPSTHWILAGNGYADTRATKADADGRYAFPDLPVGSWLVRDMGPEGEPMGIHSSSGGTTPSPIRFDCEVQSGSVTRFDIDRSREPRLHGRLRLDGRSPGPWTVALLREPDTPGRRRTLAGTATVDAEGAFVLAPKRPGAHWINLFGTVDGEGPTVELLVPVEALEGPADWSLDLATAVVTGTCDASVNATHLQLRADLSSGGLWMCPVEPGANGRFTAVAVPGTVRLVIAREADPLGPPALELQVLEVGVAGVDGVILER